MFSEELIKKVTNETIEDAIRFSILEYSNAFEESRDFNTIKATIQRINASWNLIIKEIPILEVEKDMFKSLMKKLHLNDPELYDVIKHYPDLLDYFKKL